MNLALKEAKSGGRDKTDEEWSELASVARYMSDLRESLANFQPDIVASDMASSGSSENASLWEMALQKKKKYAEARAQKQRANRSEIIREQLTDFNQL